MAIVWDRKKAEANYKKHRVEFPHVATVLDDPMAITIEDEQHDEQRFVSVGSDLLGRALVVVFAYTRTEEIRLISARKATPKERKQYEDERI